MVSDRTKYWLTVLICSFLGSIVNFYTLFLVIFFPLGTIMWLILLFAPPFIAGKIARGITKNDADEKMALIVTFLIEIAGTVIFGHFKSI